MLSGEIVLKITIIIIIIITMVEPSVCYYKKSYLLTLLRLDYAVLSFLPILL